MLEKENQQCSKMPNKSFMPANLDSKDLGEQDNVESHAVPLEAEDLIVHPGFYLNVQAL